jgi:hypothetical protein
LEVMELRPSHGRSSTNSSKEKSIEEDSLFDLAHLLTYVSVTILWGVYSSKGYVLLFLTYLYHHQIC